MAAATEVGGGRMITLTSSEGSPFEVSEAAARLSSVLASIIDEGVGERGIPLPNVGDRVLALVIKRCEKHVADAAKPGSDHDAAESDADHDTAGPDRDAAKSDADPDAADADHDHDAAETGSDNAAADADAVPDPDHDAAEPDPDHDAPETGSDHAAADSDAVPDPDHDAAEPDPDHDAPEPGSGHVAADGGGGSVDAVSSKGVETWDREILDGLDQTALYDLIIAANFLDIQWLLDAICEKVAGMMKGKSAAQIRKTFGITNDFTEEEKAEIRNEYAWLDFGGDEEDGGGD
ncbi:hypothetical protein ACP4OV_028221 [Aristida adscensionis]